MTRTFVLRCASLALMTLVAWRVPADALAAASPAPAYAQVVGQIFDAYYRANPTAATDLGLHKYDGQPQGGWQPQERITMPQALAACIDTLDVLGETTDGKRICVGRLAGGSPLLREIGRLRELTFRAVGEGTGKRMDVDAFDTWYEHIVLWDAAQRKIAGAYRLARGAPVLAAQGLKGLYTASLFDYADDALPRLAAGMELGRSFVVPDYWGSRSIDYLWQGIGAYLRRRPARHLFGPVSLSASLPLAAREWIVHYHRHYFGDPERLAVARNPFVVSAPVETEASAAWIGRTQAEGLAHLRDRLAGMGAQLPVLYKQYADLCEPDGVRFLAFGVDPAFGGCVDGLVRLDLGRLRTAKRNRYLGGPA